MEYFLDDPDEREWFGYASDEKLNFSWIE